MLWFVYGGLCIVDNMLDRMDILNASVLLMAWGRAGMNNQEMLDRVANDIITKHGQKLFYESEATSEIVNIMYLIKSQYTFLSILTPFAYSIGLSELRYRNEELFAVIHAYAKKNLERMSLIQLCTALSSIASLFPDKVRYFNDYAEELHSRLSDAVK